MLWRLIQQKNQTMSEKLNAGAAFSDMSWSAVGGGNVTPCRDSGWRLLIVYRGAHCPICRAYLTTLNGMLEDFSEAGITVYAVSADPQQRAGQEAGEEGWQFPIGCDLTPAQMIQLGLYVSDPRSPQETDRPFAEPAVFGINPDGNVQIIDISNAPFARPDLAMLLEGLKFVIDKDYPIRGTA